MAADQRRLAHASKRDSTSMKTISFLGAIFLPATLLASVFSMVFFNVSDDCKCNNTNTTNTSTTTTTADSSGGNTDSGSVAILPLRLSSPLMQHMIELTSVCASREL